MFTGVTVRVRTADGDDHAVRFRRKRGWLYVTYRGRQIAAFAGSVLVAHLAGISATRRESRRLGDLEVIRLRGTVQIAVWSQVDPHPLSERELNEGELKDLIYLARRPRLGRRVDRAREARRAAQR